MSSNRFYSLELSQFNSGLLTNFYQAINTGFSDPCAILKIVNTSELPVMISYNGINDHDVVLNDSYIDINAQYNHKTYNAVSMWKTGTVVYVKYILGVPKRGDIIVSGYYLQ